MSVVPYLDAAFGAPTEWNGTSFCFSMALVNGTGFAGAWSGKGMFQPGLVNGVFLAQGSLSYQQELIYDGGVHGSGLKTIPPQFSSGNCPLYEVFSFGTAVSPIAQGSLSFVIQGPTPSTAASDNPYMLNVTWEYKGVKTMSCQPIGADCGNAENAAPGNGLAPAVFGAWFAPPPDPSLSQIPVYYVFTIYIAPPSQTPVQ